MRIIKMSVESYLRKLGCTESDIKASTNLAYDSETLREYLNELGKEDLWDYSMCEIFYLLKFEENNEYRECQKEDTYAVIFDRLWEVEV